MSRVNSGTWAFLLMLATSVSMAVGCGGYCYGDDCGCEGDAECIISCPGRGCDLYCARAADSCGAICGDDCSFECHDTDHCSSLSGDDSRIECYGVPSCAAECGADCDYVAHNVTSAEVTVGPGSMVECHEMSRCEVTCEGPCDLHCAGSVSRCDLHCKKGTSERGSGTNRSCE